MGIAAGVAAAASAASLAGSISNMTSGGPSGYPGYQGYIPAAQPQADTAYQNIWTQMAPYAAELPGKTIPGYQTYTGNIQANPYAAGQMVGAQQAANVGQWIANNQIGASGTLQQLGTNAVPYAAQILVTGFDPQNALYNRTQQQLTDQLNALNAQSGVAGTPYGAGVEGQALSNFNIDWQNQQLARENQAAQGYGTLTSDIGRLYSGASDLGIAGMNTYQQAASAPYSTYLAQQQTGLQSLNDLAAGYNTAFGPAESLANLLQSYMGLGQSATGLAQAGQGQAFNENQILGSNLGQSLSGFGNSLGTLFNNASGSAGGSLSGTNFFGNPTADYLPGLSYASAAAPGSDQIIPM